jgi:hypothetical protein
MLLLYFNLFIVLILSYTISAILSIFTNILPIKIKNRLFFLHIKFLDGITILDVLSFILVLLLLLTNFDIILPHNVDY